MGLLGSTTTCWSLLIYTVFVLLGIGTSSGNEILTEYEAMRRSWFLNVEDIKAGETRAFHFMKREASNLSPILPRHEADSIPFSLKDLPKILRLFDYAPDSPKAEEVEYTLRQCERDLGAEMFMHCFTSVESMIESVRDFFEISDDDEKHSPSRMTTVFYGDHGRRFQNYTILEEPREVPSPNMIGCHAMKYPYAVYLCHVQPGVNKVYQFPALGDNGDLVDVVVACHHNTSHWDAGNLSFLTLGSEPGKTVCHIFPPYGNIAWVHTTAPTFSSSKSSI